MLQRVYHIDNENDIIIRTSVYAHTQTHTHNSGREYRQCIIYTYVLYYGRKTYLNAIRYWATRTILHAVVARNKCGQVIVKVPANAMRSYNT